MDTKFNDEILLNDFGENIQVILEKEEAFSKTEYNVMKNEIQKHLIPCMKYKNNNHIALLYILDGNINITNELHEMSKIAFINSLLNLMEIFSCIEANGFLHLCNLEISEKTIFLNKNDGTVKLVYLPIYDEVRIKSTDFLANLKSTLRVLITSEQILETGIFKDLLACINDEATKLEDIYSSLEKAKQIASMDSIELHFTSEEFPDKVNFSIGKDEFIIGKTKEKVDGVIAFNPAISRVHCKINLLEGEYYITDLNSSNGTFLNGEHIVPGESVKVANGDVISLANSDFIVDIRN